jgi:hypothetical protein
MTGDSLVVQTNSRWSQENIEKDLPTLEGALVDELCELIGFDPEVIGYKAIHRWRYSRVEKALGKEFLLDRETNLACIGDWCLGGRVESAFLSSHFLAEELLGLENGT